MPKHNNVCAYCGAKSQISTICGNCSVKLKLVRELLAMVRSVPYEGQTKQK